jgi:predicted nucleotidyltransferase
MSIEYLVRQKRNGILRIAERHGAYNVRVFGSVARRSRPRQRRRPADRRG